MSLGVAAVRAAIKTVLLAAVVPPGGALSASAQVHDYFRFIQSEKQKTDLLVKNSLFHAWMISMADDGPYTTTKSDGTEGRDVAREQGRYKFNVHGYYGVNDALATEKTWADIVEGVIAAFRANKKLGLAVPPFIDSGPIQWREGGYKVLPPGEGGVTCHYARLELLAKEQTEP